MKRPSDHYDRPLLLLPVGMDRSARLRLSDSVALDLAGRHANTLIVLQEAWLLDRGQLAEDRGWVNAPRAARLFTAVLGKIVEVATTQSYLDLISRVLTSHYKALGINELIPVEKLYGRGIHLTGPIDVRDLTGQLFLTAENRPD